MSKYSGYIKYTWKQKIVSLTFISESAKTNLFILKYSLHPEDNT